MVSGDAECAIMVTNSGIRASFVPAIGRAMGETLAVVMVAGNAAVFPRGLFFSFRVLTANIVMEMGYAGEVQEGALIATGAVLLLILAVNLIFGLTSGRIVRHATEKNASRRGGMTLLPPKLLRGFSVASGVLTGGVLALLIGHEYAPRNGLATRVIRGSIDLLAGVPSIVYGLCRTTLLPSLFASFLLNFCRKCCII